MLCLQLCVGWSPLLSPCGGRSWQCPAQLPRVLTCPLLALGQGAASLWVSLRWIYSVNHTEETERTSGCACGSVAEEKTRGKDPSQMQVAPSKGPQPKWNKRGREVSWAPVFTSFCFLAVEAMWPTAFCSGCHAFHTLMGCISSNGPILWE